MKIDTKPNEIKTGIEIGRQGNLLKYINTACPACGNYRWVRLYHTKNPTYTALCHHCNCATRKGIKHPNYNHLGESSPSWRGGRCKHPDGYILIFIIRTDFFRPMASKTGYVMEHRLIIAKHLGRCLHQWEVVHHKNGIKDDNRIENLELSTKGSHVIEHSKGYRDGYRQGFQDSQAEVIKELKQEIRLLRWEIKQKTETPK